MELTKVPTYNEYCELVSMKLETHAYIVIAALLFAVVFSLITKKIFPFYLTIIVFALVWFVLFIFMKHSYVSRVDNKIYELALAEDMIWNSTSRHHSSIKQELERSKFFKDQSRIQQLKHELERVEIDLDRVGKDRKQTRLNVAMLELSKRRIANSWMKVG